MFHIQGTILGAKQHKSLSYNDLKASALTVKSSKCSSIFNRSVHFKSRNNFLLSDLKSYC